MAAAVVLIGFVSILFFSRSGKDITEFAYQPYETRLAMKGAGSVENLNAFILAYQKQNYTDAIKIGNQLLGTVEGLSENEVNEIYLCLGNSYLEQKDWDTAIDILQRALESPEGRVRTEARWYLAIANLKKEDFDQARSYLQAIKAPEAGKTRLSDAKKLLKNLPGK
jgi:tetratricopeptide (TPR) repeat protein